MCRELQRHLGRVRTENRRLLRALFDLLRLDSTREPRTTDEHGTITPSRPSKSATVEPSPSRRSLLS